MPMNRKLYPKNWDAIALQVKESSDGTHHIVPTRCLHVLSYRYPPTQAQEVA